MVITTDPFAELPPIERLEALALKPGDILLVTVPDTTPADQAEELRIQLKRRIPDHDVLIKTTSVSIQPMRPTDP